MNLKELAMECIIHQFIINNIDQNLINILPLPELFKKELKSYKYTHENEMYCKKKEDGTIICTNHNFAECIKRMNRENTYNCRCNGCIFYEQKYSPQNFKNYQYPKYHNLKCKDDNNEYYCRKCIQLKIKCENCNYGSHCAKCYTENEYSLEECDSD